MQIPDGKITKKFKREKNESLNSFQREKETGESKQIHVKKIDKKKGTQIHRDN